MSSEVTTRMEVEWLLRPDASEVVRRFVGQLATLFETDEQIFRTILGKAKAYPEIIGYQSRVRRPTTRDAESDWFLYGIEKDDKNQWFSYDQPAASFYFGEIVDLSKIKFNAPNENQLWFMSGDYAFAVRTAGRCFFPLEEGDRVCDPKMITREKDGSLRVERDAIFTAPARDQLSGLKRRILKPDMPAP